MALARFTGVVQNNLGVALTQARVEVRDEITGRLVELYSDRDGVVPLENPFVAEDDTFWFHVLGGTYRIEASKGPYSKTWRYVGVGTMSEQDIGDVIFALSVGIYPVETLADLYELSSDEAEVIAGVVWNDPDPSNNGYYMLEDEVWSKVRGLPDTFAELVLTDETPGSVVGVVNAGVDPAEVQVFFTFVSVPNTGPMTLTVGSNPPAPVVNFQGNALVAGEWAGSVMLARDGSNYRMLYDTSAAARAQQSAVDAANSAEDAEYWAGQAAEAAIPDGSVKRSMTDGSFGLPEFETQALAEAWVGASLSDNTIVLRGLNTPGDGQGGLWSKASSTAPVITVGGDNYGRVLKDVNADRIADMKIFGGSTATRSLYQRLGDVVDLDDWLVGDGGTDNDAGIAALISYMSANPGKTYRGHRNRAWHFNTPFTFPSDINLFLEGGRFRKMTNTPTGTAAITLSDNFRGDLLALDIPEGVTIYRGIKVVSDTEGGFEVISQEQQNNRGSDLYQAIHVDGDRVRLHELRAHRFDQSLSLGTDAVRRYELRLESVDIRYYMRGLHLRSISEFWIENFDIRSRSPNGTPDPGQNGILMGACSDGWIRGGGIFDAPEHGFRMGGPTGCERVFVSDLLCQRSGQSGFKIWTGTVGVTTKDISLSNIRCIDSGDDGDSLAFNDFGFMLQGVDRLQANGLTAMNRALAANALDSFYLSGLTNCNLDGVYSVNPQRHGIHISQWNGDGIQPQSFNTNMITGYQSEMSNTTGNHVHLYFRPDYDVRDLMMPHMSFVGGNNGVRFDASTGEFPQPSYFSAIGRSLAGSLYSGQSGLSNVKSVNLMS